MLPALPPLHGVIQPYRPSLRRPRAPLRPPLGPEAGHHPVCRLPLPAPSCAHSLPFTPTSPQYLGRKTLPIKRGDAEPLTREDLQYDLLYYIFADRTVAFVDYLAPGKPLVNFCDLYVNALYNSSKCSKVLKDKMVETPAFAIEFAKISLLTNVGRINTTMACACLPVPSHRCTA